MVDTKHCDGYVGPALLTHLFLTPPFPIIASAGLIFGFVLLLFIFFIFPVRLFGDNFFVLVLSL